MFGLPKEERDALRGEPEARRKQIQVLISRWNEARIENQNLSEEEEAALREKLPEKWKKGSEALEHFKRGKAGGPFQKSYADWEYCPSCNGATLHDPVTEAPEAK